jgi:hypothetical protein
MWITTAVTPGSDGRLFRKLLGAHPIHLIANSFMPPLVGTLFLRLEQSRRKRIQHASLGD